MTAIINPFDASGYTLTEMTTAINILPNIYTRLGELGLFRFEGVTQRSVMIEQAEGVLDLLPTVPLGAPATVANRTSRSTRSFSVPWIPHDDIITPQDIQGIRGFGVADAADPLTTVMERKLTRMRAKHAQTREYMEINALRGVVKDGAGFALYDYFVEFGLAQISVDFVLGTAGTNVQAKCREVLRYVETELKGETMNGILALVSPTFFDKLIGHAKVEEAYKYYSTTGAQPLREDNRHITFQFPAAVKITEARFFMNSPNTEGTWKWQGSNNGTSWADISTTWTLIGDFDGEPIGDLSANTTAHSYYRMQQTTGSLDSASALRQIDFKIIN